MRLNGKYALVTGGGQGIGLGITQRFAAEGAGVVVVQRKLETAQRAVDELIKAGHQALALRADISSPEDVELMVEAALERFGRIDILVNNAALTGYTGIKYWDFLELPLLDWQRTLEVNLTGAFLCSQAVARQMVSQGGGRIINVSSVDSLLPELHCSHYAASKGGLDALTRAMAMDLARHRILVNSIAPGPILSHIREDGQSGISSSSTLLGRLGLPKEIGSVAAMLASDDGSFITGQVLVVDGGFLMKPFRY